MEALGLERLFGGCYAGRRVLVTGHTGFKGSWLTLWLDALGATISGLALDPDTHPSHWELMGIRIANDWRLDLLDAEAVRLRVQEFQPEIVFHLAAQSLVRRSYREPAATFAVNVLGLVNVLEAVRACPSTRAVVNVTTDKVYESHTSTQGYREQDALGGHDPYSASKACAELVSACYQRSFFRHDRPGEPQVRLATARAGNVVGGGDWAEDRLVPDLVRSARSGRPLQLRHPGATRPWQHVLEPLSGYLLLGQRLLTGEAVDEAWNFGPHSTSTISVGDVAERFQHTWTSLTIDHFNGPQPHEATRLLLDSAKAQSLLGWLPVWSITRALDRTARWYRDFHEHDRIGSRDDLLEYVTDARRAELPWAT